MSDRGLAEFRLAWGLLGVAVLIGRYTARRAVRGRYSFQSRCFQQAVGLAVAGKSLMGLLPVRIWRHFYHYPDAWDGLERESALASLRRFSRQYGPVLRSANWAGAIGYVAHSDHLPAWHYPARGVAQAGFAFSARAATRLIISSIMSQPSLVLMSIPLKLGACCARRAR